MSKGMSRRTFLTASAATFAAAGLPLASASAGAAIGRAPNFVIILADDLGYGATEPYGQQFLHTPNLTRMAEEGMLSPTATPAPRSARRRAVRC